MTYFRKQPTRTINGLFLVVALGIFDVAIIAVIALDAWRFWGPR